MLTATIHMLGLPYVKPQPLLYTSGSNWEYQPDPSLKQILRDALKKHYKNFTLGRFDFQYISFFLGLVPENLETLMNSTRRQSHVCQLKKMRRC